LTLVSDAVVSHVLVNAEGKAEGVYYIERTTRAHREARGKIVVLAASALESTRILLNSSSSRFPNGLGNSSGQLGHYLMDHFTLEGRGRLSSSVQVFAARAARHTMRFPHSEIRQYR
jgi:choline dehydrogenase-like flavoprotein